MAATARSVLLLTGRLKAQDEGRSVIALADRLATFGISVQVLCTSAWSGAGRDPRVIERPGLGRRWLRFVTVRAMRDGGAGVRHPDLIHVLTMKMCPVGLALAEHWHVPYVQKVDEFLSDDRLRLSRRWCQGLLASSRDLADELVREWKVPPALVSVLHPGIAVPEESPVVSRAQRVPVIGTAGPLVDASGFTTFLNAARRVVEWGIDAEFVIAGQGADEVDLRRRAERLRISDRVTFAGLPVVGAQFWSVLDVYCQPANEPAVGRTLATALAFGVPSIASDIAGLRALVEHERTGLLVPPENSGALAEAIVALLQDPERARNLGCQGRERIKHDFDLDAEAANLASLYRQVLDPHDATARHAPADNTHAGALTPVNT
jgi:glycosyltransferase involved in cell wall biosynthesis